MMAHVLLHCNSRKWPRVSGGRPPFGAGLNGQRWPFRPGLRSPP